MRILYLAHRIPYPPDKGDKLRSFRHIEQLARHHEVWCACFVDQPEDEKHAETLRSWCRNVAAIRIARGPCLRRGLAGLARRRSLTECYYDDRAMRSALDTWTRGTRFDAVVAFSSSMAAYALRVPAGRRVLDLCDLDSLKWRDYSARCGGPKGWLYALESSRLGRRERAWISAFDETILISAAEARHVPSELRGRVVVAGNGVDVGSRITRRADEEGGGPVVGFVGVMDYAPNVEAVQWFARECWPEIRRAHRTARFRIIGHRPTRGVRRLGRLEGVEVVGSVADVRAEVRGFRVSAAPLRIARGQQNKVLEAMAEGVPVVLTSGAAEGIEAADGRDYLIADAPRAVSDAVSKLLGDRELCRRIGESGRRFVGERFSWSKELARFEGLVVGDAGGRGSAGRFEWGLDEPVEKEAAGEASRIPAAAG